MNWLDALLVAVVVFFALAGAQKGFVRQLFGVIGTIASYLVAITMERNLSSRLVDLSLNKMVSAMV